MGKIRGPPDSVNLQPLRRTRNPGGKPVNSRTLVLCSERLLEIEFFRKRFGARYIRR
jgi:hypothetical protein